ncbi:hypothetical protein [Stenotrophomonas sp.]|uniref:hypothetical protein n=1 Tax=Stenotrophomonas sp. TaxID=69392 RepID=UPI0031CFC1CD
MRLVTFTCPLCGAHRQRFPMRTAWKSRAQVSCRECGIVVCSNPPRGTHLLYLLYAEVITLLASLALVVAYVLDAWAWLGAIWLVAMVLCWFPGAIRHARSPIVRAVRDPNYSYARRPNA